MLIIIFYHNQPLSKPLIDAELTIYSSVGFGPTEILQLLHVSQNTEAMAMGLRYSECC